MLDENYIAVDWGTTNRRAWLIGADDRIEGRFADNCGVMAIPQGFEDSVAQIRDTLGNKPMLLAGMVGSNKGWREAPYAPCPVDAAALAAQILWIEPGFTGIVPGACHAEPHADVMRGEEVQALGALAGGWVQPDAYICHPGTHAKWIRLNDGKIDQFRTTMTGEIFSLLQKHSILAAQLESGVSDDIAFQAGIDAIQNGQSLLSSLFSVRARHMLGKGLDAEPSFVSGLLIASDVMAGLSAAKAEETIAIIGRNDLCALYAWAIGRAGFECRIIDDEKSFLAGIRSIIGALNTGQVL